MLSLRIRTLFLPVFLAMATTAVAQTEFSAEAVDLQKPRKFEPRNIYFGIDKTRIDAEASRGRGAFIVNLVSQTSTILTPEQSTYFQTSMDRLQVGPLQIYAILRPNDIENACADWLKIKYMHVETCAKVGHEVLNGRKAVKYEGKCSGDVCHIWLDLDLFVPLKAETKLSSSELHDIHEGPQPVGLFEIPAGYTQTSIIGGVISNGPR